MKDIFKLSKYIKLPKLLLWLKNRKSYASVKKLNWCTIKNFIVALYNRFFGKWKKEQAEWRRSLVKENSPECFKKGECFCGCDLEGVLYQPLECQEKNRCFPKWMSKREWKDYKTVITL